MKPNMNFLRASILIVSSLNLMPSALAGVVYSTGFEPLTFAPGPINGQGGWSVFSGSGQASTSTIQTAIVNSGTQAVFVSGSVTGQTGPYHTDAVAGPVIDLSADLYIASSSTQGEWQFAGLSAGLAPFLGGFDIYPDNSIHAISLGYPVLSTSWTKNAWHHVDLLFSLPQQTFRIVLDGSTIALNIPFCGDNGPCAGAPIASYGVGFFDTFGSGNDAGYMDNFSVASVPEPTTMSLLALGMAAGLASRLRARR